jgi:peptidoglycan/xylan/chitin deacetylase (PgdA/CDA1 family)
MDRSSDLTVSERAATFALPLEPGSASTLARISEKASRFLARSVRTKRLTMRNSRPLVTFTFDDVAASACSAGAAILERHGLHGTYYVSGGGCGAASPCGRLATAGQVKAIWAKGHELGCHTHSHTAVARLSDSELELDIERNRSFLADIGGDGAARNFAYPYGDMRFRAKRRLENRFRSCRSVIPGINAGTADLGALRAWPLEDAAIDRATIPELIAANVRDKGWLIFYSHDVSEQPSRFGVSPGLLEFAVSAVKAAGCRVVTIAAGLQAAMGGSETPEF